MAIWKEDQWFSNGFTRVPPFLPKCSDEAGGNPGMLVQSSRAVVGFGEGQGLALMPSDSSAGATQYSSEVWRQETQAVAISCPDARGKETIRAGQFLDW